MGTAQQVVLKSQTALTAQDHTEYESGFDDMSHVPKEVKRGGDLKGVQKFPKPLEKPTKLMKNWAEKFQLSDEWYDACLDWCELQHVRISQKAKCKYQCYRRDPTTRFRGH